MDRCVAFCVGRASADRRAWRAVNHSPVPLFHLAYASSATEPFSDAELITLLERARQKNTAANVTGMLLYRGGNFMQVLEGEERIVRDLHRHIARDSRHTGLLTLLQGPIESRSFPTWTMGFRNLDSAEVRNTPGYSEFLNDDWLSAELRQKPSRTLRLLDVFRQGMR